MYEPKGKCRHIRVTVLQIICYTSGNAAVFILRCIPGYNIFCQTCEVVAIIALLSLEYWIGLYKTISMVCIVNKVCM